MSVIIIIIIIIIIKDILNVLSVKQFNNNPDWWQVTMFVASIMIPSFSKIRMKYFLRRLLVTLLRIPAIYMHSQREYCSSLWIFLFISVFFLHLNFYDWSNESSKFFPNFFFYHNFALNIFIFVIQNIKFGFSNITFFSKLFVVIDCHCHCCHWYQVVLHFHSNVYKLLIGLFLTVFWLGCSYLSFLSC